MNDDRKFLNRILKRIHNIGFIDPEDFPSLDLYMDQVTTFMESKLSSGRRYPEDKILTKTMINNYAKNNLLPSPDKKRYSREHLLVLLFIYYFKNILTIRDIQALLKPLTKNHFRSHEGRDILSVYESILELVKDERGSFDEDIQQLWEKVSAVFPEGSDEADQAFLKKFALISVLSYDIFLKKALIEEIIDNLGEDGTDRIKR